MLFPIIPNTITTMIAAMLCKIPAFKASLLLLSFYCFTSLCFFTQSAHTQTIEQQLLGTAPTMQDILYNPLARIAAKDIPDLLASASNNSPEALYLIAICILENTFPEIPELKKINPVELLTKAATQNFPAAQFELGCYYLTEDENQYNPAKALHWLTQAAKQGHPESLNTLASFYAGESGKEDPAKAFNYATLAAHTGSPFAAYQLGYFYARGYGTKQDLQKTEQWWRTAAQQGHSRAQQNLAMLLQAQNNEIFSPEAVQWLIYAACQGEMLAQEEVAQLYASGTSVDANPEYAFYFMQKAALTGSLTAQITLSTYFQKGFGTAENPVQAFEWAFRAARHGDRNAFKLLQTFYTTGYGVGKNEEQAEFWGNLLVQYKN